jgi:hypothetical protein
VGDENVQSIRDEKGMQKRGVKDVQIQTKGKGAWN